MKSVLLCSFFVFFIASCTDPAAPPVDESTAREAILRASRTFSEAYVAGDTTTLGSVYTDNAVLLPPGGEVRGRSRIKRYFGPNSRRQNLSHAMTSEELVIQGSTAVDVGTWSNTWRIEDGEAQEAAERYLVVWKLEPDGQWRISHDMWHRP